MRKNRKGKKLGRETLFDPFLFHCLLHNRCNLNSQTLKLFHSMQFLGLNLDYMLQRLTIGLEH